MEPEDLLQCSQEPSTVPCPEPDESNLHIIGDVMEIESPSALWWDKWKHPSWNTRGWARCSSRAVLTPIYASLVLIFTFHGSIIQVGLSKWTEWEQDTARDRSLPPVWISPLCRQCNFCHTLSHSVTKESIATCTAGPGQQPRNKQRYNRQCVRRNSTAAAAVQRTYSVVE